jgi:SAM-dependent methyltransferase
MAIDKALHWLMDLRNRADYALRQTVRWRRPGLQFRNQPKDGLFQRLPSPHRERYETRAAALEKTYHLAGLRENSTADNYLENLYYLDMLEKALDASDRELPTEVSAADIGCSSWFYVQALDALLRRWGCPLGRNVSLEGYEADPYRVYADFHSRMDHAAAHTKGLEGVVYHSGPFTRQPERYDLVTMLFPFVFIADALRWGLPAGLFHPEDLLADAAASLNPGGLLVVVNQGEKEYARHRQMLEEVGLTLRAAYRHDPLFFSYEIDRYVLVSTHEQHPS